MAVVNLSAKPEKPSLLAIVDDEACVREALTSLMRSVGYATTEYSSAESFLASADREPPDCLILDLHLPGMNGLALQRRLAERCQKLSIVFVSSNGTPEQRLGALQAGAVAFLSKPFSDDAILEAVHMALSWSGKKPQ